MSQDLKEKIGIVGGGVAGLAAAFYAEKRNVQYDLHEKNSFLGGSGYTCNKEKFYWDLKTMAPSFHPKEPVNWPHSFTKKFLDPKPGCGIFWQGRWHFPDESVWASAAIASLSAMLTHLSAYVYRWSGQANSAAEAIRTELGGGQAALMATAAIEKKWGLPANKLSANSLAEPLHEYLVPSFYPLGQTAGLRPQYPIFGLGTLLEALQDPCNSLHLHQNSEVTRVFPDSLELEINHTERFYYRHLINTLPLDQFWALADPAYQSNTKYKSTNRVVLFLDTPEATPYPVLHVPDRNTPIQRVVEPKNWSPFMAPMDQTHLVVEISADPGSDVEKTARDFCINSGLIQSSQLMWSEKIEITQTEAVPSLRREKELQLLSTRQHPSISHAIQSSSISKKLNSVEKLVDPLRNIFNPAPI